MITVTRLRCQDSVEELQTALLDWFATNGRDFPWRQTRNAFHILLAEALLRQTQAFRLVQPYLELTDRYPDAEALAKADVHELRQWFKPLGLVARADRLVRASQIIVDQHGGGVPNALPALLALPGLGTYSARAVLCLAFGARVPMIDEGSGRVLRRVLGLPAKGPAYSDSQLLRVAEAIVPETSTREFNLGLIDVGALRCRPRAPICTRCPLRGVCRYGQDNRNDGAEPAEGY